MARFCTNCGSPLKDGVRFCEECGARVEDAPAYTPPADETPQAPAPDPGYTVPRSVDPSPAPGYSAPGSGYSTPGSGYSAPGSGYSTPGSGYSTPGSGGYQPADPVVRQAAPSYTNPDLTPPQRNRALPFIIIGVIVVLAILLLLMRGFGGARGGDLFARGAEDPAPAAPDENMQLIAGDWTCVYAADDEYELDLDALAVDLTLTVNGNGEMRMTDEEGTDAYDIRFSYGGIDEDGDRYYEGTMDGDEMIFYYEEADDDIIFIYDDYYGFLFVHAD